MSAVGEGRAEPAVAQADGDRRGTVVAQHEVGVAVAVEIGGEEMRGRVGQRGDDPRSQMAGTIAEVHGHAGAGLVGHDHIGVAVVVEVGHGDGPPVHRTAGDLPAAKRAVAVPVIDPHLGRPHGHGQVEEPVRIEMTRRGGVDGLVADRRRDHRRERSAGNTDRGMQRGPLHDYQVVRRVAAKVSSEEQPRIAVHADRIRIADERRRGHCGHAGGEDEEERGQPGVHGDRNRITQRVCVIISK